MPLNRHSSEEKRRRRKKSGSAKQLISGSAHSDSGSGSNGNGTGNLGPRMRSRTLSLGSAAGLFGTSPPSSLNNSNGSGHNLAHSLGAASKRCCENGEMDFFSDQQVQVTGSIFRHRDCLSSLFMQLPRWKRNGIHVKMEDDCPQGNDETRIFVLTSLGDKKMREVTCVLCHESMPIYDRYPLIDGTFFMSPLNHHHLGVKVKHDGKEGYLLAICVMCLEHPSGFGCTRCGRTDWFPGDRLVLGTLYTFDVLACQACCSPTCSACQKPLPVPANHSFSTFSEPTVCPNCGHSDLHFIRRLENICCVMVQPSSA